MGTFTAFVKPVAKYGQSLSIFRYHFHGLIQTVFRIGLPILGTLIWACPNSILNKTLTTSKYQLQFFIISVT